MDKGHWSIAEARNNLAEVIRRSHRRPQFLESRGREVAAVVDVGLLGELVKVPRKARGAILLERLEAVVAGEDVGLEAPRKTLPRDPFEDMGDE